MASSMGTFEVYPYSAWKTTKRADGFRTATSARCVNGTPSQVVSSLDQRVTQWMSSITDLRGRARTSAHFSVSGDSTSPQTRKSQRDSSGYSGVRPKWRTGNFSVKTWPGGMRLMISGSVGFFCQGSTGRSVHGPISPVQAPRGSYHPGQALCLDVLAGAARREARLGPMPPAASSPFATFAATADAIAATTSKLAKRDLLAAYLRDLPAADVPIAATFFAGRPLPGAADRLGLGWVQLSEAVARASGAGDRELSQAYLRHSDVGDAALELLEHRRSQGQSLTMADVDHAFRAMSEATGSEARTALMTELLLRASPAEARYLGKIAARELRIGLREGLLEEAIAAAFERPVANVRRALMLVAEPGETATLAREDRLGQAALHLGRPIRFMLATPVADAAEVVRRVGEEAWIEDKYDGIRCQLHIGPGTGGARLFSRDLNDVTISFPEVAAAASRLDGEMVLDGELVPYGEGSVLDFASPQTRLGRVKPCTELVAAVPVVLIAFDLLHGDGLDALDAPLRERRAALEELALPDRTDGGLLYSHLATARGAAEVDAFFDDARARHDGGLMLKDPDSTYQPGRRGLGWLKLKRALATLDCVVVGVDWGHGKP